MPIVTFTEPQNTVIPAGTYFVQLVGCKELANKKDGTIFLSWEFEVLEGEHAGEHFSIPTSTVFSPKSKSYALLSATGKLPNLSVNTSIDTDDFIGSQLYVTVFVKDNQNGGQNNDAEMTGFMSVERAHQLAQSIVKPRATNTAQPAAQPSRPVNQPAARPTVVPPPIPKKTAAAVSQAQSQPSQAPAKAQPTTQSSATKIQPQAQTLFLDEEL